MNRSFARQVLQLIQLLQPQDRFHIRRHFHRINDLHLGCQLTVDKLMSKSRLRATKVRNAWMFHLCVCVRARVCVQPCVEGQYENSRNQSTLNGCFGKVSVWSHASQKCSCHG